MPREPGGEETVTAAHVEDGPSCSGNAGSQPRIVMEIGVPQSVHAVQSPWSGAVPTSGMACADVCHDVGWGAGQDGCGVAGLPPEGTLL